MSDHEKDITQRKRRNKSFDASRFTSESTLQKASTADYGNNVIRQTGVIDSIECSDDSIGNSPNMHLEFTQSSESQATLRHVASSDRLMTMSQAEVKSFKSNEFVPTSSTDSSVDISDTYS